MGRLTGIDLALVLTTRKKKKKNKKVNDTGQKKDQSQLPPVRSTDTAAPQTAGISGGKEGVDTAVEHRKLSSED